MGDIHGGYKALLQCLERSKFDYEKDTLIQLGDVADGWSEVYECVEELLKIKNLIAIKGNHDDWFLTYINTGINPGYTQGGRETIKSYQKNCPINEDEPNYVLDYGHYIPESHKKFFKYQHNYYIDEQNRCFVHGGFNRHLLINEQTIDHIYYWDRDLWSSALSYESMIRNANNGKFKTKNNFKEIFIGHTSTVNWSKNEVRINGIIMPGRNPIDYPMKAANIYNLDTGGGFKGKLTIMDVDTKQYWQSDLLTDLYSNEKGRN